MNLKFSRSIFAKKYYSNVKFPQNPSREGRVEGTDRHDEANGHFRNFAKASQM